MSRFLAGFGLATVLWATAAAYAVFGMGYAPPGERGAAARHEEEAPSPAAAPTDETEPPPSRRRRARRQAKRSEPPAREATPTGEATSGDNLGEDEVRMLDMSRAGGEAQLTAAQIDAGFDSAMGRIRRCLVLMAGDDPVRGRIVFGMRIAGSGEVRAVRLSGPAAATTGETGDCLRAAARAIRFDAFDGPEMVVRYPLTLE